ncbi:hypothetical protein [Microbacterium sp.]|uniref:hypothetical protein n=1 Tax=Microbacterium sp. TaxID=51671 RepID=UPI003C73E2C1
MSDDLSDLYRDLTDLADLVPAEVETSIEYAAQDVMDEWKKLAKRNPMGDLYTESIDYTLSSYGAFGQGVYAAEIGPDTARYGGKTGKGGLVPGMGIFDDPESTPIGVTPVRARRRAELFAAGELTRRIEIAVQQSQASRNL